MEEVGPLSLLRETRVSASQATVLSHGRRGAGVLSLQSAQRISSPRRFSCMNSLECLCDPCSCFQKDVFFESFLFLCLEEGSSSAPHLSVTNSLLDAGFILLT